MNTPPFKHPSDILEAQGHSKDELPQHQPIGMLSASDLDKWADYLNSVNTIYSSHITNIEEALTLIAEQDDYTSVELAEELCAGIVLFEGKPTSLVTFVADGDLLSGDSIPTPSLIALAACLRRCDQSTTVIQYIEVDDGRTAALSYRKIAPNCWKLVRNVAEYRDHPPH